MTTAHATATSSPLPLGSHPRMASSALQMSAVQSTRGEANAMRVRLAACGLTQCNVGGSHHRCSEEEWLVITHLLSPASTPDHPLILVTVGRLRNDSVAAGRTADDVAGGDQARATTLNGGP